MEEENKDDPSQTAAHKAKVEALSSEELILIDNALLSNTSHTWRKVARVVASAMLNLENSVKDIPDVFYSQRVQKLVKKGQLQSQGNLNRMRYCEVKRPGTENETTS